MRKQFQYELDIYELPSGYFALIDAWPDLLLCSWLHCVDSQCTVPSSETPLVATGSQTQTACHQCGNFTRKFEEKYHVRAAHYFPAVRTIK